MRDLELLLDALCQTARPLILQRWNADSCIASTRVAVEVLRRLDVPAHPLTVAVQIFNAEAVERMRAGKEPVTAHGTAQSSGGPWSIGLGMGGDQRADRWPGHLVCVAGRSSNRFVLDLSLDQASRPHKQLDLRPLAFRCPADWPASEQLLPVQLPAGAIAAYEPRPTDRSYLTSPDWTALGRHRQVISRVEQQLRRR